MVEIATFFGSIMFITILGAGLEFATSSIFGFILFIILFLLTMFITICAKEALETINDPSYKPDKIKGSNPYSHHNYR